MSQFGSGFRPPAAPVEEGKVYEAKIEDMGREGDGLCRVANFVVFIPGTKVGDQVKFKVTKVLRRVAFDFLLGHRVEACPVSQAFHPPGLLQRYSRDTLFGHFVLPFWR